MCPFRFQSVWFSYKFKCWHACPQKIQEIQQQQSIVPRGSIMRWVVYGNQTFQKKKKVYMEFLTALTCSLHYGGFTLKTPRTFSVLKTQLHLSFLICVWQKLGQITYSNGYRDAIVQLEKLRPPNTKRWRFQIQSSEVWRAFSQSTVLKMFSVHTRTKSRRFQIPPV